MSYDQNSFLQGIAVGKSLKGWTSGLGTSVPTCWNDEGVYSYFYIDYHLPISAFSLTRFNLATRVLCESGELSINAIKSVNSTTFKVYCDISKAQNGFVMVVGYNSFWLTYDSGYTVPEYSSVFWLDGKQTYTPDYLEDDGTLTERRYSAYSKDTTSLTIVSGITYNGSDEEALYSKLMTGNETLSVNYL